MAVIDGRPGAKVSELARSLSIHLSTASNMLDKLESKGYVRRERTPGDQRVVKVYLTAVGRKCLRRAPRPVEGVLPAAIHEMPRAAVRRLHRDLAILLDLSTVRDRRARLRHLSET
jgi:DNA-binding MarR family transcriptional regulator